MERRRSSRDPLLDPLGDAGSVLQEAEMRED